MQPGQILVNEDGRKCKVLGVCGEVIFRSSTNNFDVADSSIFTWVELIKYGWSLLEEPWVPSKENDVIFIVYSTGNIDDRRWGAILPDEKKFIIKTGNHARTQEDAELYRQKLIERMGRKEN